MDEIRPKVLVVEDYTDSAECLAMLFAREGFDCEMAGDIREAVAKFNAACDEDLPCFDLIILDVHLPSASGLGLLRAVREVGPDIPISLVTAYDDDLVRIRAKQFNATYDTKPIEPSTYIPKVVQMGRDYAASKFGREHPQLRLPEIIEEMMDRAVA